MEVVVELPSLKGALPDDDVVPPYTTAIVPTVAITTASRRLNFHRNFNSLTLITYAKKALVFQMAFGILQRQIQVHEIENNLYSPVTSVTL